MQMREKVRKSQNTEPAGQMRNEKLRAVVARSTFLSQNVQSTPLSDHFWKLRCRKSARRCGAKHISKSKCTKHTMPGPLLEVEISKKCTPLWREAHFEVKMLKTPMVRTTFGGSDVASHGRHKGLCTLSKVSKTWGFCSIFNYNHHYTTLHSNTLQLQLHLHYIPLHYAPLHSTTLHYTQVHSITLNYTQLTHYITLRNTPLHYITLHYTTTTTTPSLHSTTLHSTTLHYTQVHSITFNYTQLHYTTLHYTTLHYTTLHYTTLHCLPLHYITLHYITLHYTPLHYTTLHYTRLHYPSLHYTTLHSSTLQLQLHNYTPLH